MTADLRGAGLLHPGLLQVAGRPDLSIATCDDAHLANAIVDIHADDPEFGYRFIADELERAGHEVGEGRVHRLCREHRIWSTTTKKGRRSAARSPGRPSTTIWSTGTSALRLPNVVWLTDITEHPTAEGQALRLLPSRTSSRTGSSATPSRDRMTADLAVHCPALSGGPAPTARNGGGPLRPGRSISFPKIPRRAQGQRPHRLDGSGLLSRRQRGHGVLLLAAAEERAQPAALEDP